MFSSRLLNPYKKAAVSKAISMIPPGSRILDVGCGTGIPVSEMLSQAGLKVVGFDIPPKMVELAKSRIRGTFSVSDMVDFQIEDIFSAIFVMFSDLQMSYAGVHAAAYKYASALQTGGIFVIGQTAADTYVNDGTGYDETKTYVEDIIIPYFGQIIPHFSMSAEGQKNFLRSMGLEIVSESIDSFKPDNPMCNAEVQQYLIARRPVGGSNSATTTSPKKDIDRICETVVFKHETIRTVYKYKYSRQDIQLPIAFSHSAGNC